MDTPASPLGGDFRTSIDVVAVLVEPPRLVTRTPTVLDPEVVNEVLRVFVVPPSTSYVPSPSRSHSNFENLLLVDVEDAALRYTLVPVSTGPVVTAPARELVLAMPADAESVVAVNTPDDVAVELSDHVTRNCMVVLPTDWGVNTPSKYRERVVHAVTVESTCSFWVPCAVTHGPLS